jgi:hypothetical protein
MSIIDSSPKPKDITLHNGASISANKSRFGGGSLFLDGSNKYASIPDSTDFGFGTGDFTIEMWVYPLDNNSWRTLIALGTHTNGLLWRMGAGGDQLYFNGYYWSWGASNVPLNTWSHLALVRNSGAIKVYINGTEYLSTSDGNSATNLGSSKAVNIGAYNPGSETFNGYIDEIRITKGIGTARYPSNFDIKTLLVPFPSSGTPITPPEVISNLSALARDQRVDLSWTAPAEDNGGIITDYSLQYSTDNIAWSGYNRAASAAPSGMISGLTNGTTYSVRVAPINIAGTGSYVSQSNVVPILPPVLSISQEPLNNRVTSNSEAATFSISAELTNNTNSSTFSYQWQKYDFVFGEFGEIFDYRWNNISNSNSSSINISSNAFEGYVYGPPSSAPIRCILTSPYETKMSKTVRLVNVEYLSNFYFYLNADPKEYGSSFGGNFYERGYDLNSNQRVGIYVENGSSPNNDSSWYTGSDTKLKFQYSLDGSSWNDVDSSYSQNFNSTNYLTYNNIQTPAVDLSGRVYFRMVLENLWPYTTDNGTSSTSESLYSRVAFYYWVDYAATVPGVPTNVVGSSGDGQVSLNWNAPALTGGAAITSYSIQYRIDGGNWETFGTSSSTSANVTGLQNGSVYSFKVAATNSVGTGNYSSNSSNIMPLDPSTPAPAFYSPSASWSSINFSGDGTLNNKYLGSRSDGGLNSISIRVTSAGKLHITADNISSDGPLTITRNSTILTLGDGNGYSGNPFNFETTAVSNGQNNNVNAEDLITIADNSYDYLTFNNLRVWWTPS